MQISLDQIAQLAAGASGPVTVGRIVNQARRHLSQKTSDILLSPETVAHILQRHGDHVDPHHLLSIPEILRRGMWLADRDRCCQVIYRQNNDAPPIKMALKATERRHEVYVTTFHITNDWQVTKYVRKAVLLRQHL